MNSKQTHLYRYDLEYFNNEIILNLKELEVIKVTPKGFWVEMGWNRKKWVSNFGKNRYAQETKYAALKHFIRRKIYRNRCIDDELERNEIAIVKAKNLLNKDDKQRKKQTPKGGSKFNRNWGIRKTFISS